MAPGDDEYRSGPDAADGGWGQLVIDQHGITGLPADPVLRLCAVMTLSMKLLAEACRCASEVVPSDNPAATRLRYTVALAVRTARGITDWYEESAEEEEVTSGA